MTALPLGFVLDDDKRGALPEGFVLDDAGSTGNDDRGFLGFLNQGIASILGAPVDAMGAVVNRAFGDVSRAAGRDYQPLEPFGGSASISRGMSALGIRVADPSASPETLGEYMGQGLGGAAGSLLPGAGIVGAAFRSASPVISGAASTISSPFLSTPLRALAAEASAGAGAGVGMSVADQLAPDNPYAQMAGAMVGGGVAGMGPNLVSRGVRSLPGVQLAEDFVAGQIAPFTERGAMNRARGRVGGLVEDAATARANLERGTIGDLSPAVASGDRRLMALEQAVRNQEAPIDLAMRQAETGSMDTLRRAAMEPGAGVSPQAAQSALGSRIGNLVRTMQNRTAQAMERAQQRVAELQPQGRRSQASIVVREELEEALRSARSQEREIWSQVPRNELVPTNRAKAAYRSLTADMPRAQRDNIPAKARAFLEEGGNQTFRSRETVNEMHGLYSALREESRIARAANEANRARIADALSDALLEDLGAVSGAQGPLREALDFSRELNRTFRQGNVGRVLGSERTGGASVMPELTLDSTVGRGGVRGAVAMDEISRATGQTSPALSDYMQSRFADTAIRGDQLSPERAQSFIRQNADALDRLGPLRDRIRAAIMGTDDATRTGARMATRQTAVEGSAAARFAGANPGSEIQTVLRSPNPRQTAAQLMRQARRDPTGQARLGLKGALLDDLMISARMRQFDEAGQPMISGRALRARLADEAYGGVASEILSPDEMSRMRRIADEFGRLETMQGRLPDVGPIMGDQPNSIVAYLARVMAARSGAAMGAGTSGASLQTASMASNRMQRILQSLTNDKAEQLIIRAVSGDRELFDALLQPASQLTRRQESRVIEALGGTAGAMIANDPEDLMRERIIQQLTGGYDVPQTEWMQ